VTYARRTIDLVFNLGSQTGGADQITLTGLKVAADIQLTGGPSYGTASIRAFGVPLSVINQLTTLGQLYPDIRQNTVTVIAGDERNGKAAVFTGQISEAYASFDGAPDTMFTVNAYPALLDALRPLAPTSTATATDAATIMSGLASQMNYLFENNGVKATLPPSYFPGTGRQQAEAIARAGNFDLVFDDQALDGKTLVILPRNGVRGGGVVPRIAADTGMVGYPAYVQNAMIVTSLYNPNVRFNGEIEVQSSIPAASGRFKVYELSHSLSSETNGGPWFTRMQCITYGREAPK
jgi:hypothetical protein